MAWGTRKTLPKTTRNKILQRDNHTCQHCGDTATEVDHIQPIAFGGTHHPNNLQSLCPTCHQQKTRQEENKGKHRQRAAGYMPKEQHPGLQPDRSPHTPGGYPG